MKNCILLLDLRMKTFGWSLWPIAAPGGIPTYPQLPAASTGGARLSLPTYDVYPRGLADGAYLPTYTLADCDWRMLLSWSPSNPGIETQPSALFLPDVDKEICD